MVPIWEEAKTREGALARERQGNRLLKWNGGKRKGWKGKDIL
jgi:hypothetical protein